MFAVIFDVTSGGSPSIIGVWNSPGAIAMTRTPDWASSRAAGKHIDAIAPLDAA